MSNSDVVIRVAKSAGQHCQGLARIHCTNQEGMKTQFSLQTIENDVKAFLDT
jgi:hypothetical protein